MENCDPLKAVEFFINEVVRFRSMDVSRLREELGGQELDSFILGIEGISVLICGSAASGRIDQVAEHLLSSTQWSGRVHTKTVSKSVMKLIVTKSSEQQCWDSASALNVFMKAIEVAAEGCHSFVHFLPCHVVDSDNPREFQIGPVHFQLVTDFIAAHDEEMKRSIDVSANELALLRLRCRPELDQDANRKDALEEIAQHAEEVVNYLRQFRWVARVECVPAVEELSRYNAEMCVEAALHYLRLYLGSGDGDRIRADSSPMTPKTSASISKRNDRPFTFAIKRSFLQGNSVEDGWWNSASNENGHIFFHEAGAIIETLLQRKKLTPLSQRLFDAVTWFGQAVSDTAPGSRILKFIAAAERISLFDERRGKISKRVVERIATLCLQPGDDFVSICDQVREVYRRRSDLAHGTTSPYDKALLPIARAAERFARHAIIQFHFLAAGQPIRDPSLTGEDMVIAIERLRHLQIGGHL